MINVLFVIFILLQIADLVITVHGIKKGRATEGNPLVRKLQKTLGLELGTTLPKIVLIAGVGYAVYQYNAPAWALIVLCGFYAFVVVWNLRVRKKAR